MDVDIHQGEVVVIIGPSGGGKSTLLRSLNLLEEPTEGAVFFEGVDITKKREPDKVETGPDGKQQKVRGKKIDINVVRQKMGMVFQQFNLFPHKDGHREHDSRPRAAGQAQGGTRRAPRRRSCSSA